MIRAIPRLASLTMIAFMATAPLAAQTYPDHPVRITVPFAPGGIADITTRIVADNLSRKLGQNFIVENQQSPGGITAARGALSGGADGYTLTLFTNGTAISVGQFKNLRYDPIKEFTPISGLGYFDFAFATSGDGPYKTLGDFLKAAKDKPGSLNIGTVAIGSTQNLSAELFKTMAGIDVRIVPYRTTPDLIVATIRGDVAIVVDSPAAMKGNFQDGKLRALAISGGKRSDYVPGVPTVAEAGVPGFEVPSWNALFAPAGVPPRVIETLNKTLQEILTSPEVKKQLLDVGITAYPTTPDEIGARLKTEIARWDDVIVKAGIEKQ
jgi:tripartite-type tricarboxylate transporter receptor subunit TctC